MLESWTKSEKTQILA